MNKCVNGKIVAMSQAEIDERAAEHAAHLAEKPKKDAAANLQISDGAFVRVIEDLINTLITKGVITLADLPAAAQTKINDRKNWRATVAGA